MKKPKLKPKTLDQTRAALMCPVGFRRYTPKGEYGTVTHLTENLTRVKFENEGKEKKV